MTWQAVADIWRAQAEQEADSNSDRDNSQHSAAAGTRAQCHQLACKRCVSCLSKAAVSFADAQDSSALPIADGIATAPVCSGSAPTSKCRVTQSTLVANPCRAIGVGAHELSGIAGHARRPGHASLGRRTAAVAAAGLLACAHWIRRHHKRTQLTAEAEAARCWRAAMSAEGCAAASVCRVARLADTCSSGNTESVNTFGCRRAA